MSRESLVQIVEKNSKYKLLVIILAFITLASLFQNTVAVFSIENLYIDSLIPLFLLPILTTLLLIYLLKTKNTKSSALILILASIPLISYRSLDVGGIYSNIIYWFYVMPVISIFFVSTFFMYITVLITMIISIYIAYQTGLDFNLHVTNALAFKVWPRLFFFIGPFSVMVYFLSLINREKNKASQSLLKNQEASLSKLKLASISDLSGGLAHEINNPLTNINGLLFKLNKIIAKDEINKEELAKISNKISENSNRISKIVSALNHISKERSLTEMEKIEIKNIFSEIEKLLNSKRIFKSIDFKFENKSKVLSFQGHSLLVIQVIVNLIENAIDAVSNIENPMIRLICRDGDKNIIFEIIDNGHGISREIENEVFLPFYSTKNLGSGTGLGLSLAKGILDAHSGDIYFNSSNSGTIFTVSFPCTQ